jgi:hypothetical protein
MVQEMLHIRVGVRTMKCAESLVALGAFVGKFEVMGGNAYRAVATPVVIDKLREHGWCVTYVE